MNIWFYGLSGIIGSVLTLLIGPIFTRRNAELAALHNESVWRKSLFELSAKTHLTQEDLELFRTCLSATRGENEDDDFSKKSKTLDDLCIYFYDVLIKNPLLLSFMETTTVFRKLCRLLLKSDWNKRVYHPNIIESFCVLQKRTPTELAASKILSKYYSVYLKTNKDAPYPKKTDLAIYNDWINMKGKPHWNFCHVGILVTIWVMVTVVLSLYGLIMLTSVCNYFGNHGCSFLLSIILLVIILACYYCLVAKKLEGKHQKSKSDSK